MIRNPIEAVYRRTDLFERRRLMNDWAAYLVGERRAVPLKDLRRSSSVGRLAAENHYRLGP